MRWRNYREGLGIIGADSGRVIIGTSLLLPGEQPQDEDEDDGGDGDYLNGDDDDDGNGDGERCDGYVTGVDQPEF